jgi:hypothetical protein
VGRQLILLGANFAQYRPWDGVPALDCLLTRPEVDAEFVGCLGHSSGAIMTRFWLPSIPGGVADAEQNLVGVFPLVSIAAISFWRLLPNRFS